MFKVCQVKADNSRQVISFIDYEDMRAHIHYIMRNTKLFAPRNIAYVQGIGGRFMSLSDIRNEVIEIAWIEKSKPAKPHDVYFLRDYYAARHEEKRIARMAEFEQPSMLSRVFGAVAKALRGFSSMITA